MFRTIIRPSLGAQSSKLYHAFGTFVQKSLAAMWLKKIKRITDRISQSAAPLLS